MRIFQPNVSEVIGPNNECLIIPVYQRRYQWNAERWQSLINDIAVRSEPGKSSIHWIGIVLISKRDTHPCPRSIKTYGHVETEIIDGQQRILTLRVWLQALFDFADEQGLELTRPEFVHIACQEMDRVDFANVLDGNWKKQWKNYSKNSSGLMHAYTYFRYLLWLGADALTETEPLTLPKKSNKQLTTDEDIFDEWQTAINLANNRVQKIGDSTSGDLIVRSHAPNIEALIETTLSSLTFVSLETEQGDEEPSEIFDALNGQRMELEQFDHVRNFIFTGIPELDNRKDLYDSCWILYERAVEQHKGLLPKEPFNSFMYEYLISLGEGKYQQKISRHQTKVQFVRYFNSARSNASHEAIARDSLLPAIRNWLCACINGQKFSIGDTVFELPEQSQRKLFLIQQLSQGPATPLLMNVINGYFESSMNSEAKDSLLRQISAVESFLARKVIITKGLQALRSQLMQIADKLGSNFTEAELIESLHKARPSDSNIIEILLPTNGVYETTGKDLYERIAQKSLLSIFQGIENYRSGGKSVDLFQGGEDKFTIEHIYPQSPKEWGSDLGLWGVQPQKMNDRLHVLGNLTVYPERVNKEMGNKRFGEKVKILTEPEKRIPLLQINATNFLRVKRWTPTDVDTRTKDLVDTFLKAYK